VITIEDPIEFIYTNARSIIEQREIGSDTPSWHSALRTVLRQAPDVIVLGELRDLESIGIALGAAETGHLVMASVHSSTAAGAVSRMVDVFPPAQAPQIRLQLAQTLRLVFAQRLIPGRKPETRTLLYEILVNTPAVANLIRMGELEQIPNAISAGRDYGMISFTQCQCEFMARGIVGAAVPTPGSAPRGAVA
jgi:twitching motility protein PilT